MADQVIPTPEYVESILSKNTKLWESEEHQEQFQETLAGWTRSLNLRFSELRGDKRKKPVVSIVIPAHNEEAHMLATLESISLQKTSCSFEVIVVANNCSSDDRTAFLARATGVTVIEYTMKNEEGLIIVSADADIVALPAWIERIVQPLLKDSSVGFTTSHSHLYHQEVDSKVAKNDVLRRSVREFFDWTGLIGLGNNMAFRKKEAIKMGGYNLSIYPSEDTEIGLRLSIFQQKKAKLIKHSSSAIWMSPRRVKAFGDNLILSHMNWQGKILDVRDEFQKKVRK
jgi:glycosyltransferase involved in cell wall biosynthesis